MRSSGRMLLSPEIRSTIPPPSSSPELSQVVPQDVEAHAEHRRYDHLPEELVEEDQSRDYRQPDVDAADQVDELAPETCLDEREQGDAEDEHGDQMFSLEQRDPHEAYEHQAHAHGRPRLGHAAYPEFVLRGRAVNTGNVGARRVALSGPQTVRIFFERLQDGPVGGQLRQEPI